MYTPSRRGLARRSHQEPGLTASEGTATSTNAGIPELYTQLADESTAAAEANLSLQYGSHTPPIVQPASSRQDYLSTEASSRHVFPGREHALGLFYSHFFEAHPFLVPHAFYNDQKYPEYLDLAVCSIGICYTESAPEDFTALRDATSRSLATTPDENTVARVQALLLQAIRMHTEQRPKEAASYVRRAASIAQYLGMHDPSFARTESLGSLVREESVRRTWWELHTVDVYFAALHRQSTSETASIHTFPLLPCTQALFESGQCDLDPPNLASFDNRIFGSVNSYVTYASSSFRIDAVRIMGRVLALASQESAQPDQVQALDNLLTAWEYNLPPAHRNVIGPSGKIDHMLFQARCFIFCANILLHFPRSHLPATVPSAGSIACGKGFVPLAPTSRHHALKAIAASQEFANLATIPWPLERHSPLFVCGLVLSCIVQLAAGMIHQRDGNAEALQHCRDRVVLLLGALQRLGEIWTLAGNAARALRGVAAIVFVPPAEDLSSSEACSFRDSAMGANEDVVDTLWFDLFAADDMPGNIFDIQDGMSQAAGAS